jgi:hypothetical protein
MTQPGTDLLSAAASLFNAFTWLQLIPALTMGGVFLMVWMAVRGAQNNPDNKFDIAEFFRDEHGKLSLKGLLGAGCFVMHSWFFYSRTVSNTITFNEEVLYVGTWSAAPIFLEALSVWKSVATAKVSPP